MRGLTADERRYLQEILAAGTIWGSPPSIQEGLIATGRMAALPGHPDFTYITPEGKLALELDAIARSGKVEV